MKYNFLTDSDYKVVIGDAALNTISQLSAEVRKSAEAHAIDEMQGYLNPKYNVESIFSATGDKRSSIIVMYTCDISLYHMMASMPQKMGSEIRQERYERAIKWLEGVANGKIIPQLPLANNEDDDAQNGDSAQGYIAFNSDKKLKNNW